MSRTYRTQLRHGQSDKSAVSARILNKGHEIQCEKNTQINQNNYLHGLYSDDGKTDTITAHILQKRGWIHGKPNMAANNKLEHSAQSSINSQGQVHRFIIDSVYYPDWLALHFEPRPDRGIYTGQPGIKLSVPNGILNRALKHFPHSVVFLLKVPNTILRMQYFPPTWKHFRMISILKLDKDPAQLSSHQPRSLLDTTGKLCEKILLTRILYEVGGRGHLGDEQFGFRLKRT